MTIGRYVWDDDLRVEVVTATHWYVTPEDYPPPPPHEGSDERQG